MLRAAHPIPGQRGSELCEEVLNDVDAAMHDSILPEHEYFAVGGLLSTVLSNPDSSIDPISKLTVAIKGASDPIKRKDGSRRDIDLLVNTVLSPEDAETIKQNVQEAVGDHLLVSVFGFDPRTTDRPSLKDRLASKRAFMSMRTVDESGIYRYELFPLEREVPAESYEPWKLLLPSGNTIQTFHPAGHVLAYSMRTAWGCRTKDKVGGKYSKMLDRVLKEFPGDIRDGTFKPWMDFAVDIQDVLREGSRADVPLHPAGLSQDQDLLSRKGRVLRKLESAEWVRDIAYMEWLQEGPLKRFIGSK